MVRLKFLVFAFLVIGLGLAHLPLLSGPLRARAVEGATVQAAGGAAEVARRVESRRAEVQAVALKLASTPEVIAAVNALQPPKTPPVRNARSLKEKDAPEGGFQPLTSERFGAVRGAAEAVLPKELKGVVVALVAGDEAFYAVVGGEISSDKAKLDVAALAKAGNSVADALGSVHAFASVPVLWGGDVGLAPAATLVVGAPLVDEALLESAVKASGASAVALLKGDAVAGVAGPEKAAVEASLKTLTAGVSGAVLRTGHLKTLGPVMLPAFTDGDAMGGKAPLLVGSRSALGGLSLDVVALAGTESVLGALAGYQQNALMALAGLLGLTLVWTLLMGSSRRSGDEVQGNSDTLSLSAAMAAAPMHAPPPPQPSAPVSQPPAPVAADAFPMPPPVQPLAAPPPPAQPSVMPSANPFAMAPPPAQASPPVDLFAMPPPAQAPLSDPFAAAPPPANDFPFGAPPPPAAPPPAAATPFGSDPFASAEPFPFPSAPPPPAPAPFAASAMPFEPEASSDGLATASPRRGAFAFEDQPTAAYSLQQAVDPFALANAAATPDNPETTRVAAIPRELLQASQRPPTTEIPVPLAPPRTAVPLPSPASTGNSAVALSEEQHFQEVFREFVTTRERCGEPADGLTYDKFVQKLRKNKEQLVQKYACKTVRFQVYVKEGKAALKATPVKD